MNKLIKRKKLTNDNMIIIDIISSVVAEYSGKWRNKYDKKI
jgi:hypothetical protein